jgi:hypothetical protein
MRKSLPIVVTLLFLVAGFLVYLRFQPKLGASDTSKTPLPTIVVAPPTTDSSVGPGSEPWLIQWDQNGNRSYQFRAENYDPTTGGVVKVKHPEADIFMQGGQVLHIDGTDGIISNGNAAGGILDAGSAPPHQGNLRNVVAKLFDTDKDAIDFEDHHVRGKETLTVQMANAEFDNDTFRLFTQEYAADDGQTIKGDLVPVTLHASDYDFEGSGLVMYWNDVDRRLKSLEIAHGKQLTIHNVSDTATTKPVPVVVASNDPPAGQVDPGNPRASGGGAASGAGSQNVNPMGNPIANPGAAAGANANGAGNASGAANANATGAPPRNRYYATFYENVRIDQDGHDVATGDQMNVDMALKDNSPSTTQPAVNPQTAGTPASTGSPAGTGLPATTAPSPAPTVAAATQPGKDVVVFWTGKLRVIPSLATEPLAPGQSIIHLAGEPVTVHQTASTTQPASDIVCTDLTYRTADSSARFSGTPVIPVTITQKHETGPDSIITGERLLYSQTGKIADWEGAGRAQFRDPKDVTTTLVATWQNDCIVNLIDAGGGQLQIKTANLDGGVIVDHPKFHLDSTHLELAFEPTPAGAGGASGVGANGIGANGVGANAPGADGAAANTGGANGSSSTEIKQIMDRSLRKRFWPMGACWRTIRIRV